MAQPIYVSPSTTLVQVNTLQSPYTLVYPNSVQFTGQTFTVLDATSSFQAIETPILLSTINHKAFVDGTFSTSINQPQGYITLQSQSTNQWGFLNSFPFRNDYVSAGSQFLSISSFFTAKTNTLQQITSSITTENLIVSGNLFVSSGIILAEGISTFGTATFTSTLTVFGSTFFSSCLSTSGDLFVNSSLTVKGNFLTNTTINSCNSITVSSFLYAQGGITYTPYIQLGGSLVGTTDLISIFVPGSDTTLDVGASAQFYGGLKGLSTLNVGEDLKIRTLSIDGNLSLLSSAALYQSVNATFMTIVTSNVSTLDSVGIGGGLNVYSSFDVPGIMTSRNLTVRDVINVGTFVSTNFATPTQTAIYNDLDGFSTIAQIENLQVDKEMGLLQIFAKSTLVGGTFSVGQSFVSYKDTFIGDGLFVSSSVSTLRHGLTNSWASTLGNVSTYRIGSADLLHVASTLTIQGTLNTNCNAQSTILFGLLSVERDFTVRNTLTVSSYTLPSSLVAFNLGASTIHAAYLGIASSITNLQRLQPSSLVIGSTTNVNNTAENYLPFYVNSLSTFIFSSFLLQNTYQDFSDNERIFNSLRITSSFGVQTIAPQNSFDIKPLAYLFSTSYAYQVISTAQVIGGFFQGAYAGDGSLLSNIMYPRNLSVGTSFISTVLTSNSFVSTAFISSGISLASRNTFSTLQVNTLNIFGNAYDSNTPSGSNVIVAFDSQRALIVNNMYIQKPYLPAYPAFVTINPLKIHSDIFPVVAVPGLEVGNTLRYTDIVGVADTSLIFDQLNAENLFVQTLGSNTFPNNLSNTIYVSSGIIRASSTSLFIDQNTVYSQFSTNIIQPLFSTLVFNSSLFLKRDTQEVGINTVPNATLDTRRIRMHGDVQVLSSITIQDSYQGFVPFGPLSLSTLWLQGSISYTQDFPSFGKVGTSFSQAFGLFQDSFPITTSSPSFINTSSIYVSFNDVLYCDTNRNVGINTYFDPSSTYRSTFTTLGSVRVSTTTTTQKAIGKGIFYSIASI